MQYADLKLLKMVCYVVGLLSIPFAIVAYVYEDVYPIWGVYPYRDYAFPLVVLGIIFIAISLVIEWYGKESEEKGLDVHESL